MPSHTDGLTRTPWDTLAPLLAEAQREVGADRSKVLARMWRRGVERPLRLFMSRPGKAVRGNLANLAWGLERRDEPPAALGLLVELIHAGSLILDDIQDRSRLRRGGPTLHRRVGMPVALNAGSLLLWLPMHLMQRLDWPPGALARVQQAATDTMVRCHLGQALDLVGDLEDLPQRRVHRVVKAAAGLKTARLMGLAAELGAAAAGASPDRQQTLRRIGRRLGAGLQILNDVCDLVGENDECKRFEDLRAGKPTWPWAVLASTATPVAYRDALAELTAVRKGHAEPCALAQRLLAETEAGCRRLAARAFRQAESLLHAAFGDGGAVRAFGAEIGRLEHRYAQ